MLLMVWYMCFRCFIDRLAINVSLVMQHMTLNMLLLMWYVIFHVFSIGWFLL